MKMKYVSFSIVPSLEVLMVGVQVWSLDSPKSKYTLSGHSHVVNFLDFFTCDSQQYLISGSWDGTAKVRYYVGKYIHTTCIKHF